VTSLWGAIFLETTGPKKQGSQPQKGFSSLNTFLIDLDWPNQANDRKSLILNDIFSDMDASQMQVGCKGVPGARFRWFGSALAQGGHEQAGLALPVATGHAGESALAVVHLHLFPEQEGQAIELLGFLVAERCTEALTELYWPTKLCWSTRSS